MRIVKYRGGEVPVKVLGIIENNSDKIKKVSCLWLNVLLLTNGTASQRGVALETTLVSQLLAPLSRRGAYRAIIFQRFFGLDVASERCQLS